MDFGGVTIFDSSDPEWADGWRRRIDVTVASQDGTVTLGHYSRQKANSAAGRLPSEFRALVDLDGQPFIVELRLRFVVDRPRCESVMLVERDLNHPRRFTQATLRQVPVRELVELARLAVQLDDKRVGAAQDANWSEMIGELASSRRGRKLGDGHYRHVAAIYRAADAGGEPPTRAVAVRMLGTASSTSTAARWVMEARARGHLGPTSKGRKGE